MNEEAVTIKVQLTEDNFYDFQRETMKVQKHNYATMFFLPLLLLSPTILSAWYSGDKQIVVANVIVFIVVIAMIIAAMNSKKKAKDSYKANKAIQQEYIYTIKHDGLECKSTISFSDYKWDDLYSFQETNKIFLVFTSPMQCFIIPKESFENDDRKIDLARSYFSNLPLHKDKTVSVKLKRVGLKDLKRTNPKRLTICIIIYLLLVLIFSYYFAKIK